MGVLCSVINTRNETSRQGCCVYHGIERVSVQFFPDGGIAQNQRRHYAIQNGAKYVNWAFYRRFYEGPIICARGSHSRCSIWPKEIFTYSI